MNPGPHEQLIAMIRGLPREARLAIVAAMGSEHDPKLTPKQQLLADEYAVLGDDERASQVAGYKHPRAEQLERKEPAFAERAAEVRTQLEEASLLKGVELRNMLHDALNLDILDYFDVDELGELHLNVGRLRDMPSNLRRLLSVETHMAVKTGEVRYSVSFPNKQQLMALGFKVTEGEKVNVEHSFAFPWDVLDGTNDSHEEIERRIAAIAPPDPGPIALGVGVVA